MVHDKTNQDGTGHDSLVPSRTNEAVQDLLENSAAHGCSIHKRKTARKAAHLKQLLATDYSHVAKPGTTERLKKRKCSRS